MKIETYNSKRRKLKSGGMTSVNWGDICNPCSIFVTPTRLAPRAVQHPCTPSYATDALLFETIHTQVLISRFGNYVRILYVGNTRLLSSIKPKLSPGGVVAIGP